MNGARVRRRPIDAGRAGEEEDDAGGAGGGLVDGDVAEPGHRERRRGRARREREEGAERGHLETTPFRPRDTSAATFARTSGSRKVPGAAR